MRIVIKISGMLCIMAAALLTGSALERRMKKRWQLFREMRETLIFLEKEMTYHRSPIYEAFYCASKRCRTELCMVFSDAAGQVEQRDGRAFQTIWEENLKKHIPEKLLTDDELRLFGEVSAALCNTDLVMQRTILEKYVDRFRLLADTEEQTCREKGGLYRRLAAAAGVFLVILLL